MSATLPETYNDFFLANDKTKNFWLHSGNLKFDEGGGGGRGGLGVSKGNHFEYGKLVKEWTKGNRKNRKRWKMGKDKKERKKIKTAEEGRVCLPKMSTSSKAEEGKINKEGIPIDVHNKKKVITLGVTSTIPTLSIPNILLLASSIVSSEEHISKSTSIFHQHLPGKLELKRLFPLCLVKISIHNLEKKQLRLKLVTGRTYYLQLYPTSHQQQDLFVCWIKLVQMLQPSSKINFNQQKLENKKLKKHGTPLVPPPKPKKTS
ncbi:Golgi-associated RAB2 interactor protein 2-like [Ahaetulla prasina]|uniref:Golgi-associated RAB2 interactor protein 2-like n=1 Tax=Ahaetulla prasina TaxID=499056 RepID=UPI00264932FC|nr:Golgi-associated RAB2 interactor protein 2-like [Ahaetulla prasina]